MSNNVSQGGTASSEAKQAALQGLIQTIFAADLPNIDDSALVRRGVPLPEANGGTPPLLSIHNVTAAFYELKMKALTGIAPGTPIGIAQDISHLNDLIVVPSSRATNELTGEERQKQYCYYTPSVTIIATPDAWNKVRSLAADKYGEPGPLLQMKETGKAILAEGKTSLRHVVLATKVAFSGSKGVPTDIRFPDREVLDHFFKAPGKYEPRLTNKTLSIGFSRGDLERHARLSKIVDRLVVEAIGERARDVHAVANERGGTTWVTTKALWHDVQEYAAKALLESSPNPDAERKRIYPQPQIRPALTNLMNVV